MLYRRLGATGLQLSAVSLGCWATIGERLDQRAATTLLAHAYDLGVNFFDSAETYADGRSEQALGTALRQLNWPRETFLISSKVFYGIHQRRPNTWGLSRKHIVESCHAALDRLGLDHLDLFLCHRPDPDVSLHETVRAMSDLVTQGKILYWGTSEWPADLILQAHVHAISERFHPPVAEQTQYNALIRNRVETEYEVVRERLGLGITTWSPLAHGVLAGRYDNGLPDDGRLALPAYRWLRDTVLGTGADEHATLAAVRAFSEIARDLDLTAAQLALAWVLRNPTVTSAITGASTTAQLDDTLQGLAAAPALDEQTAARIDACLAPIRAQAERRQESQ